MTTTEQLLNQRVSYPYGFTTDVAIEAFPLGISEEIVREISHRKAEPEFLLRFRLKAYERWCQMQEPRWSSVHYPPIDYQSIRYYSVPASKPTLASLDELDPKIKETFDRLGIPLDEQKRLANVAVDVVFDSVSIGTTFQKQLQEAGVVLCSMSEAVERHPEMLERYLGSVVPIGDNYFTALNSAVFSDGSFVWVPKGVRCPIELGTYFRINDRESGQFERTLIVAEEGSYVSYLEGCTAPSYDRNQLHAAVVELIAEREAEIKYSTVQNWYPGDPKTGVGGIYNFVTKRGLCKGDRSKITWTQVEAGAAITWKYPSCILKGDDSVGEFFSVSVTNGKMQADTGTKMIHIGKRTRSTIISKAISADESRNVYRGAVKIPATAEGARNYTKCDSMLVGDCSIAATYPYIEAHGDHCAVEHEASTGKLTDEQLLYLRSRGIPDDDALNMIVNGFCKDVLLRLPLEFAQEATQLLAIKLEGSVG